ncbi:MAG TPA: L-seryl-tRNA(Sec) selenium transferase [Dehalococcoidales bacterium]|nr:L-seryl-tRNA(Sec) selenium transferase [Dehalococcoidales bacterium]
MENKLRHLPSVDKLLSRPELEGLKAGFPHELLVELIRENLDACRSAITRGASPASVEEIAANVVNQAQALFQPGLRPVINATGVILHTNLGRAPLSQATITAMQTASAGYNNLEFDLQSGERGSRHTHIEPLLCRLCGSEAALVVNNNAAAVMLGLSALAKRRQVIVSRGQAVEIGGGFRIPEVLRQSGAKLVEVGTTNCTYIRDFEEAASPQTAAFLRVHSSNFQVIGFSHNVTLKELVTLGKEKDIPVLDDLGSGCPLDTAQFGLSHEPTIQESMAEGADLAFFSGDKLLGGPQAGIIVGKKVFIDRLKKHPLVRALRIDKMRLAGLSATLIHYLKGEALTSIPVWQMISMPLHRIEERASRWAEGASGSVVQGESLIGGGSLPGAVLPTRLLCLGAAAKPALAQKLAELLRKQDPPVVGRLGEGLLYLDPRTVLPHQDEQLVKALQKAVPAGGVK